LPELVFEYHIFLLKSQQFVAEGADVLVNHDLGFAWVIHCLIPLNLSGKFFLDLVELHVQPVDFPMLPSDVLFEDLLLLDKLEVAHHHLVALLRQLYDHLVEELVLGCFAGLLPGQQHQEILVH
jgi:hypothetical protein